MTPPFAAGMDLTDLRVAALHFPVTDLGMGQGPDSGNDVGSEVGHREISLFLCTLLWGFSRSLWSSIYVPEDEEDTWRGI